MNDDRFIEPDLEIITMLNNVNMTPDQFRDYLVTTIKTKVRNITTALNNGKQPGLKDADDLKRALHYLNRLDGTDIQPGEFFKKDGDNNWGYTFMFIDDDDFLEPNVKIAEILFRKNLDPQQGHERMLNFALRTANRLLVHKSRRSETDKEQLIKSIDFLNQLNGTKFNRKDYFKVVDGYWKVNNPYSSN